MTCRRAARITLTIGVGTLTLGACQEDAPRSIGSAAVYASGFIRTAAGRRDLAIRLDRQACVTRGNVNLRDASGLGVLVILQPAVGWAVRRYSWPTPSPRARGLLKISGVDYTYPLWRGTTVITRADGTLIEGEIDWTVGEPSGGAADTTSSRLRVVGRFRAEMSCDD